MAHQLTGNTIASTFEQLFYRNTTEPSTGTTTTQLMTSENDQTDDIGTALYIGTQRVGIGTATPGNLLEVQCDLATTLPGDQSTVNGITIRNDNTTNNNYSALTFIGKDGDSDETFAWIACKMTGHATGGSNGDLVFGCMDANTMEEKMRLKSTGKVGIGQSDPVALLEIEQGASGGSDCVRIDNKDIDQNALYLQCLNTTSDCMHISADYQTTAHALSITSDALTTGGCIKAHSDSSDTGTRSIVQIVQDHASATGATGLYVQQDSSGYALHVSCPTDTTNFGNGIAITTLDENTTSFPLYINTNNATPESGNVRFAVRADGNVGIGTASPRQKLDITDDSYPTISLNRGPLTGATIEDDELLGSLEFGGYDGDIDSDWAPGAYIRAYADANWGSPTSQHAAPTRLEFFTQNTSGSAYLAKPRMTIMNDGNVGIGWGCNDPNALLELDQLTDDDAILKFVSSDVAHGIIDHAETDVYGFVSKVEATSGGMRLVGFKDADGVAGRAVELFAELGEAADTTKSTSAVGVVSIGAAVKASGTGIEALGTDGNLCCITNNGTARFIFDAEGSGHADVEWVAFSDRRLKKNIEDIPYGLSEVLQLEPKKFDRIISQVNEDEDGIKTTSELKTRKMIGFIAQEVKEVIPELVKDIDEDKSYYTMDDGKLMAVLVKAVQELTAKVEALENA